MTKWYLKKPDGSVFGPVAIAQLKHWAAEGRVSPKDEVSEDKEAWVAAPDLDDLEMLWTVKLRNKKEYGPVNLMSLCDLLDERTISPNDEVVNRKTGDVATVNTVLLPALLAERDAKTWEMNSQQAGWKSAFETELGRLKTAMLALESRIEKDPTEKAPSADGLGELHQEIADLRKELQQRTDASDVQATSTVDGTVVMEELHKEREATATMLEKIQSQVDDVRKTVETSNGANGQEELSNQLAEMDAIQAERSAAATWIAQIIAELQEMKSSGTQQGDIHGKVEEEMNMLVQMFDQTLQRTDTITSDLRSDIDSLRGLYTSEKEFNVRQAEAIEDRLKELFRQKKEAETDLMRVRTDLDRLRKLQDEERALGAERETDLAELVEQLQHEKEAMLLALKQARGRKGSRRSTIKVEDEDEDSASETEHVQRPPKVAAREEQRPKKAVSRDIVVTRISRGSMKR